MTQIKLKKSKSFAKVFKIIKIGFLFLYNEIKDNRSQLWEDFFMK